MNRLWERFCNYFFNDCFWCGKRVYLYYATIEIGTIEHKMHDGPIQNCADQYSEWHNRPTYVGTADEHLTMLHH